MKNFTFKFSIILLFTFFAFLAKAQVWNISSASFNALGTLETTTTVEGLTIYANSEKSVTIDENNKSLDGMDFTHRLKLGGSGQFDESGIPLGRVLAFEVSGNTHITVIGMSSSSSSDRELIIAAGNKDNELGRFPALGSPITKGEFDYIGGPTTIMMFSPSSGVNVYYIKATPIATQSWNISNANFNALGTLETNTTVDGLTIYANSEKSVTIDENNKSLDGMDFTHRLKLGGSGQFDDNGAPLGRVLTFDVTGSTLITVIGMSSSSSADRELVIAAGDEDTEVARFPALGSPISKGEYVYSGGATTIYMFSPSSGVNLYYIKATPIITQEWNISNTNFNGLGTLEQDTTIDGFTIYANSEKSVTIDENNKSLEGMDFTHRLKLGGSGSFDDNGTPLGRVLAFDVAGNTKITVMAMSSSSSADRELFIAAGDKDTEVGTFPALGASLTKGEYSYKGDPTTIFMYSPSSGVNVYYVKAEPDTSTTSAKDISRNALISLYPNPVNNLLNIKSEDEINRIEVYNILGAKMRELEPLNRNVQINTSDFKPGAYIIKLQADNRSYSYKILKK